MKTPGEILETARERGRDSGLPYAGAVTPEEAYALLQAGRVQVEGSGARSRERKISRVAVLWFRV